MLNRGSISETNHRWSHVLTLPEHYLPRELLATWRVDLNVFDVFERL